jgi:hypothetical protein
MVQRKLGTGWMVAGLALVAMACVCSGLSPTARPTQPPTQTAQAPATSAAVSTTPATATSVTGGTATPSGSVSNGGPPDNVPVMEGAHNFVTANGSVTYDVTSDLQTAVDFYETGMPSKGWTEIGPASGVWGSLAKLSFTNATQRASIGITSNGSQPHVGIYLEAK